MQEGFEDTGFAARGWYDNTSLTITAAEHRPGGTKSLEATFNQGSSTPAFGGLDADPLHTHRNVST